MNPILQGTGEIQQLLELESPEEYVCSVRFIKEGNILGVGTSTGEVQLWDVENIKKMRTMTGHSNRVSCLSWNQVSPSHRLLLTSMVLPLIKKK